MKSLFHYLEYKDVIDKNPFSKMHLKFREPVTLPKTIPLQTVETLLSTIYKQRMDAKTDYQRKIALRDAAVVELLFATGIRISELCTLKISDVNLYDKTISIFGKGSKERKVQIGSEAVVRILMEYQSTFLPQIQQCKYFFVNQNYKALSNQSVRRLLN